MGGFKKGQSGNPKGRPKEYTELKALCREYTTEAVAALVEVLRTGQAREKVLAANALLDRGYGKPEQSVDLKGEITKYVIRVPAVTTSAEEWAEQHKPKIQ